MKNELGFFIEEWLKTAKAGDRLGKIRELAAKWQTSYGCAQRVIQSFIKKGQLASKQGKGIFAVSLNQHISFNSLPDSAERVRRKILNEIACGNSKPGRPLPQVKRVSAEYNVSPSTVIKAYRELIKSGIIEKSGKTFFVCQTTRKNGYAPTSTVLHFRANGGSGSIDNPSSRISRAINSMYNELSRNGARIVTKPVEELSKTITDCIKTGIFPGGILIEGFDRDRQQKHANLLNSFFRIDTMGRTSVMAVNWRRDNIPRKIEVFSDGNFHTERARIIAEFIVSRSYNSVAAHFDSDMNNLDFNVREMMRILPHLARLKFTRPVFFTFCRSSAIQSGDDVIRLVTNRFGEKQLNGLLGKYGTHTLEDVYRTIVVVDSFSEVCRTMPEGSICLFRKLDTAAAAYHHCIESRINVPSAISLMECEMDTIEVGSRISSCIFDVESTGYFLSHILLRDIPITRTTSSLTPTRALIVEKETT